MLEKTLESPLDCKKIQPVHPKEDQSWVFIGRTDAKAETPVLWPPHAKSWLIGKDSDAGRDWGQEEKGTTEDEMAGWHHGLDGHEFGWTPGVGDGQGGLACYDSWGRQELDTTERLNWTEFLKVLWNRYNLDIYLCKGRKSNDDSQSLNSDKCTFFLIIKTDTMYLKIMYLYIFMVCFLLQDKKWQVLEERESHNIKQVR